MMQRLLCILLTSFALLSCGSAEEEQQASEQATESSSQSVDTLQRLNRQGAIRVEAPRPGETLSGANFEIRGAARTFERNVLYRLVLDSVLTLASGFTTADSAEIGVFSPFSVRVSYLSDLGGEGMLEVYEEDAESSKEINRVTIPVVIAGLPEKKGQSVVVYFPNRKMGSRKDCRSVYPITRELPEGSEGLARGAVYHLLKGLSEEENKEGYQTRMPKGARLNSISMSDGVAHLDFSRHLQRIKKACYARTVRAQIEQTLAQFPTVNAVAITVDGMNWTMGRR